jgi:hypothetical protein
MGLLGNEVAEAPPVAMEPQAGFCGAPRIGGSEATQSPGGIEMAPVRLPGGFQTGILTGFQQRGGPPIGVTARLTEMAAPGTETAGP